MEVETEGVRVLTVHASKGLEAPIVFLPDSCGGPDARHEPKLMRLSPRPGDPPVFAWARKSAEDADAVATARAEARAAQAGEHRRLLYVAMTRAAQRLIVAGYETSKTPPGRLLVRSHPYGSCRRARRSAGARSAGSETILRFGEGLRAEDGGETPSARAREALPGWLIAKAAPEAVAPPLNPSRAGGVGGGDPERALEGRLAHALLEMLPNLPPERRPGAATAYLDAWGGALAESARAALASKVLAAIGAPELSPPLWPRLPRRSPADGTSAAARAPRPAVQRPSRPSRRNRRGCIDRRLQTGRKAGSPRRGPCRPARALSRRFAAAVPRSCRSARALVYLDGPTLAPIGEAELDAALDAVAEAS